jgi:hypothetical protein
MKAGYVQVINTLNAFIRDICPVTNTVMIDTETFNKSASLVASKDEPMKAGKFQREC